LVKPVFSGSVEGVFMYLASLLLAVAISALVSAYFGLTLIVFTTIIGVILGVLTYFAGATALVNVSWVVFLILGAVLNVRLVRRALITNNFLKVFRKLLPPISQTEREALEAGAVWWEKDLFSGKPDWSKLHAFKAPTLSDEEKAFLAGPVEKLCQMMDDWKITDKHHDLPKEVWDFLKKEKFFGLIIPRNTAGLAIRLSPIRRWC
jgi:acyl-CoA dehydrogenase